MGWMHDTLHYFAHDPIHRRYHHNELTFRAVYQNTENFVMPLSHDEVVHGKGSLLNKMPGDDWQKFANLRLLLGYMWTMPGKKLLFMGGEIGQWSEWSHDGSVDWHLMGWPSHYGVQQWVSDLNRVYQGEPGLYELDCNSAGFAWVDCNDAEGSTLTYLRSGQSTDDVFLVACNFTPVPRENYLAGVPLDGWWQEVLNSDARAYWGSGWGNQGGVHAQPMSYHGRPYSVNLTLPPLAVVVLKRAGTKTS
jgi:1,4-alpha-glucan branching enzyme